MIERLGSLLVSPLGTFFLASTFALAIWLCVSSPRGRRLAAWMGGAAFAWLWIWSTPIASDSLRGWIESQAGPRLLVDVPVTEVGVVLGGGVSGPRLPDRPDPDLTASADRLWHAARLFHAGKVKRLVLSGGVVRTGDGTEADAMKRVLVELGVPKMALLLEKGSTSTHGNAEVVSELLGPLGIREIVLITSALHMPRARATFERAGFKVHSAPGDFEAVHQEMEIGRLLPDAAALHGSTRAIKELVGWWWVGR